jgi:hypothetical protein
MRSITSTFDYFCLRALSIALSRFLAAALAALEVALRYTRPLVPSPAQSTLPPLQVSSIAAVAL